MTTTNADTSVATRNRDGQPALDYDAIVIGAGFAGLALIHYLREIGLNVRVFDRASDIGGTWNWNNLSDWLHSPKNFAPGTKMTFAGISNPQDRADLIAYLNQQSSSPLPLPAAPAEAAAQPAGGGQTAEKEPVLTEQQAGKNPKNVGGDAAVNVTGPASKTP